jgi:hypothetical protein
MPFQSGGTAARRVPDCRHAQRLFISLGCLFLSGCIGVTPMPKTTRTPQGIEQKTIDLDFVHAGQTTRAEVVEKLKAIDTGYRSDRFFLGRWSSSSMGGWAFLVGMGGGVGNASRLWKSGNLLIQFDENGVVCDRTTFTDRQMAATLAPVVAADPFPKDGSREVTVKYSKEGYRQVLQGKIVLSAREFEFEELGDAKKRWQFSIPPGEVLSLTTSLAEQNPDPVFSTHTLHFAENLKKLGGPRGKAMQFEVNSPDLVQLLSFVSYAASSRTQN